MKPFKIWCETKEERDKVVKKLAKMGCKWSNGFSLTGMNRPAPIGYYVQTDKTVTHIHDRTFFLRKSSVYKLVPVHEFLKDETIVIFRNGQEVIALDKSTGKRAVSKCNPADEFDFSIGAKLAFERLLGEAEIPFEPKKLLTTEICITRNDKGSDFIVGKIYQINDGKIKGETCIWPLSGDRRFIDINEVKEYFAAVKDRKNSFPVYFHPDGIDFVEVVR